VAENGTVTSLPWSGNPYTHPEGSFNHSSLYQSGSYKGLLLIKTYGASPGDSQLVADIHKQSIGCL
jgi:hypothetical protein